MLTAHDAPGSIAELAPIAHRPAAIGLVEIVMDMMCSIAVNDPDLHDQNITLSLVFPTACTALLLGTLSGPSRPLGTVVLLGLTFVSVLARHFGPRGFALGMVAFFGDGQATPKSPDTSAPQGRPM